MELRDLEYFLAIAEEGSITGAARRLHMTQPALTRQLKALEADLGKQLVHRGNRILRLTEEGMILRKRAREILSLAARTESEVRNDNHTNICGDVYICAGETQGLRYLTRVMHSLQQHSPDLRFHISSGDTDDVKEKLDQGLVEFGLMFGPYNTDLYDSLTIPFKDTWGLLMRREHPLASHTHITRADLDGIPLILPRNEHVLTFMSAFFHGTLDNLHISATYTLLFNASLMVADGMGCAVTLDQLLTLPPDGDLCFRPLYPPQTMQIQLVWKRNQIMTRAARAFLEALRALQTQEKLNK